jgi:hypothetical protein
MYRKEPMGAGGAKVWLGKESLKHRKELIGFVTKTT